MTTALLAFLAALAWGIGDFLGGRVSRQLSSALVVWAGAIVALVLTAGVAVASAFPEQILEALAWGVGGGVAVSFGALALYTGLAVGRTSVVAPIAGVTGAAIPVLIDIGRGASLSVTVRIGIALALVAIVLLTTGGAAVGSGGLRYGAVAGAGFGLMFVFVGLAPASSGLWPVVGTKVGAVATTGIMLMASRRPITIKRGHWLSIVGVGVFDVVATVAYLQATRAGLLSVAAVIASFYPAPTVVLAAVIAKERLLPVHWVGAGLALASIALISL